MREYEIAKKMELNLWQKFLIWLLVKVFKLADKSRLRFVVDERNGTICVFNQKNLKDWSLGDECREENQIYNVGGYMMDIYEPFWDIDGNLWVDFKY